MNTAPETIASEMFRKAEIGRAYSEAHNIASWAKRKNKISNTNNTRTIRAWLNRGVIKCPRCSNTDNALFTLGRKKNNKGKIICHCGESESQKNIIFAGSKWAKIHSRFSQLYAERITILGKYLHESCNSAEYRNRLEAYAFPKINDKKNQYKVFLELMRRSPPERKAIIQKYNIGIVSDVSEKATEKYNYNRPEYQQRKDYYESEDFTNEKYQFMQEMRKEGQVID